MSTSKPKALPIGAQLAITVFIGVGAAIIGLVSFYTMLVMDYNRGIRAEYEVMYAILEVRGILDEESDRAADTVARAATIAYDARRANAPPDLQEAAVAEYERAAKALNVLIGDDLLDPMNIKREYDISKSVLKTMAEQGGIWPYLISVAIVMIIMAIAGFLVNILLGRRAGLI